MEAVDPALTRPVEGPEGGGVEVPVRGRRVGLLRLLHSKRLTGGVLVVLLLVAFCFAGPLFYHASETTVNLGNENLPPGPGHPLGTDIYGIDVLQRLMVGGRASLELSFSVAVASTVMGALYGAISGMTGGFVDGLMMRLVDTILAVPTFILLLIAASLYSLNLATIIVVLSVLSWPGVARLVRGQVLVLRERDFVHASTIFGAGWRWKLTRHILPNTFNVIVVTATFTVADAIYALSALSFLGLGPQPPFADWGTMLTQGVNNLFDGYWWQVYPTLIVLVVTVLAFRQIGDAINDLAGRGDRGR